jgi:NADH dehydrogenase FAD-containing subunit
MASESDVRVWLVERGDNNRDLIVLKYATPDGDRVFRRELAAQAIDLDTVTAAKDVSPDNLESVTETDVQERYEAEATRMADEHDPEDTI